MPSEGVSSLHALPLIGIGADSIGIVNFQNGFTSHPDWKLIDTRVFNRSDFSLISSTKLRYSAYTDTGGGVRIYDKKTNTTIFSADILNTQDVAVEQIISLPNPNYQLELHIRNCVLLSADVIISP